MADVPYVTRIRTSKGEAQIDYNALANLPTAKDFGAVPSTRTINGYDLSSNVELSASDVGAAEKEHSHKASDIGAAEANHSHQASDIGAVPASRKVNGNVLNDDITLTAEDVGAAPANHSHGETGGSIIVDSTLSPTSTNPVQNKVVHAAIKNLENAITDMEHGGTGSDNGAEGLKNLFAAGYTILSANQYGDDFPAGYTHSSATKGTLFLKKVSG